MRWLSGSPTLRSLIGMRIPPLTWSGAWQAVVISATLVVGGAALMATAPMREFQNLGYVFLLAGLCVFLFAMLLLRKREREQGSLGGVRFHWSRIAIFRAFTPRSELERQGRHVLFPDVVISNATGSPVSLGIGLMITLSDGRQKGYAAQDDPLPDVESRRVLSVYGERRPG